MNLIFMWRIILGMIAILSITSCDSDDGLTRLKTGRHEWCHLGPQMIKALTPEGWDEVGAFNLVDFFRTTGESDDVLMGAKINRVESINLATKQMQDIDYGRQFAWISRENFINFLSRLDDQVRLEKQVIDLFPSFIRNSLYPYMYQKEVFQAKLAELLEFYFKDEVPVDLHKMSENSSLYQALTVEMKFISLDTVIVRSSKPSVSGLPKSRVEKIAEASLMSSGSFDPSDTLIWTPIKVSDWNSLDQEIKDLVIPINDRFYKVTSIRNLKSYMPDEPRSLADFVNSLSRFHVATIDRDFAFIGSKGLRVKQYSTNDLFLMFHSDESLFLNQFAGLGLQRFHEFSNAIAAHRLSFKFNDHNYKQIVIKPLLSDSTSLAYVSRKNNTLYVEIEGSGGIKSASGWPKSSLFEAQPQAGLLSLSLSNDRVASAQVENFSIRQSEGSLMFSMKFEIKLKN